MVHLKLEMFSCSTKNPLIKARRVYTLAAANLLMRLEYDPARASERRRRPPPFNQRRSPPSWLEETPARSIWSVSHGLEALPGGY